MSYVTIKVCMEFTPTAEEIRDARLAYSPTDEASDPDDEWLAEEVAMNRLELVHGVIGVACIDKEEG